MICWLARMLLIYEEVQTFQVSAIAITTCIKQPAGSNIFHGRFFTGNGIDYVIEVETPTNGHQGF